MFRLDSYPYNFAPQKPQQNIDAASLLALLRKGAWVSKKYNGNRVHVLVGGSGVRIFSRNGTLEWTCFLPSLCAAIGALRPPAHSFFDAELYTPTAKGTIESTKAIQEVINPEGAFTPAGITAGCAAEARYQVRLAFFDVLFLNGHPTHHLPLAQRLQIIKSLPLAGTLHVAESASITSLEQALNLIAQYGWEGLVVADRSAPHKVNLQGNTKRGESYKIKPKFTEEFTVIQSSSVQIQVKGVPTDMVGVLTVADRQGNSFKVGSFDLDYDRIVMLHRTGYLVEVAHFGYDEGNLTFPKVLRVRDITSI